MDRWVLWWVHSSARVPVWILWEAHGVHLSRGLYRKLLWESHLLRGKANISLWGSIFVYNSYHFFRDATNVTDSAPSPMSAGADPATLAPLATSVRLTLAAPMDSATTPGSVFASQDLQENSAMSQFKGVWVILIHTFNPTWQLKLTITFRFSTESEQQQSGSSAGPERYRVPTPTIWGHGDRETATLQRQEPEKETGLDWRSRTKSTAPASLAWYSSSLFFSGN